MIYAEICKRHQLVKRYKIQPKLFLTVPRRVQGVFYPIRNQKYTDYEYAKITQKRYCP